MIQRLIIIGVLGILLQSSLLSQKAINQFPENYVGEWIGELMIYNAKGLQQSIEMELIIHPIDSTHYSWSLIYGEDKIAGLRPYELVILDINKGHFEIDEKNSIVLDGYLLGGTFYQQFEVMGSFLLVSLEKIGDKLIFEIVVSKYKSIRTTGGTSVANEEIPAVQSFEIIARQKAELSKKS